MIRESNRILGINPGTRYLGIAVLYGQELMDWRIKVLKGKWSEEKIKKAVGIVSELIERYEPNALVIKKLHPSRRTENLLRMTNKIIAFARRKGLKVFQNSIKRIEKSFVEGRKLNKRNLIEQMVRRYPELNQDLKKEKSHGNPYYQRMFEAVALGTSCLCNNKELRQ